MSIKGLNKDVNNGQGNQTNMSTKEVNKHVNKGGKSLETVIMNYKYSNFPNINRIYG
jgi:hypothetical protein